MAYNVCNGASGAGTSSITVTVGTGSGSPTGTASGDLVYVAVGSSQSGVTVSSLTDSKSNTYAAVVSDTGQNPSSALWASLTTSALVSGTDTITATFSGTASKTLVARALTGVTTGTADKTNHASGSSASPSSGSTGTLTQAAELVVGVICDQNAGNAPTGLSFGAATTAHLGGNYLTVFDQSVSSTAAQTASGTIAVAGWTALIATFKLSSAVTVTTTSPLPGGTVGVAYSDTLAASGGTPPYKWALTTGTLPAGLALTGTTAGLPAGATVTQSGPNVGTSVWQADMTAWSSLVYQIGTMKIYFQQGQFPTSKSANGHVQAAINLGVSAYLCYKPAYSGNTNDPTWPGGANKPAQGNATTPGTILGDQAALIASVSAMITGGLSVAGIVLWQEADGAQNSVTADQLTYLFYQNYAALKAAFPSIPVICNFVGNGNTNATVSSYFPGPTPSSPNAALYCDGVGVDLYAPSAVDTSGNWVRPVYSGNTARPGFADLADYAGVAFGWMESGTSASTATRNQAAMTKYLSADASIGGDPVNSIQAVYAYRITGGLPIIPYMWWQDDGNPGGPNVISSSTDFRIPLLRSLAATVNQVTSGGVISGTPTTAGTSTFTVQVTDASASKATKSLSLTISTGSVPSITTVSLPNATTGSAYLTTGGAAVTLTESGGTGPFTWSNPGGGLPPGLSLAAATGIISGTATTLGGYSFSITVTDSLAAASTATLSITVVAPAPPIVPDGGTPTVPQAGYPQLIIEAGFTPATPVAASSALILNDPVNGLLDTGTLSSGIAWTDITAYARTVTISRPSTRVQGPLRTYQAGTVAIVLDNDGRFDPDNTAGPYYPSVRPMIPLRVRAVYANVTYYLFSGFTDSWAESPVTYDAGYSEITVSATDGFKILGGITLPPITPTGRGETSGARITRILNDAGWYTDHRRIDTGNSPLQAATYGDTALNLMQAAADTETGELYIDGAGNVVFRQRTALLSDARSTTAQAVFGDLPGTADPEGTELACAAIASADDDTTLANDVQATNATIGTLQEATDATSVAKYLFPRTYARSDLLLLSDPEALGWAQWVLYVSLAGEDRFDSITVDPVADTTSLFPQVLAREIGDRIAAYRRPVNSGAVITRPCFIAGITCNIDVTAGTWQTVWDVQDATRYQNFLILDAPVLGKLSSGNKLAF